MTTTRELKAINCGQKSFYKKAYVTEYVNDKGITYLIELLSYNVSVCSIVIGNYKTTVYCDNMYSRTTKRHIRDFIIQMFSVDMWSRIEQGYNEGMTEWEY